MATSKKFSELPVASSMNNGDLFAVAQEDAQAETGYTSKSATALVVGKKLNGEIEYATDLPSFPSGYQNPLDALEYLNSKILDLYPVNSASGSIANFTTSLALPLVALKAYITAQGGGGTPSSPVAITGFNNVVITQADGSMQTVETYTIQLGQTVYGGYVDKGSGKLYATYKRVLLSDLSWSRYASTPPVFYARVDDKENTNDNYVIAEGFESIHDTTANVGGAASKLTSNYTIIASKGSTNPNIYLRYDEITSASDLPQALENLYCVYQLATPVEVGIVTIPDITALVGENNIFADSGDIEVSFKQGIQEYIDAKIAETQALIL